MTLSPSPQQVRKHAYDVFISFSHEDDADRIYNIYDNKGGSEKVGWVQYFQVELEKSLSGDHGMRLPEVYYFPRDTQTGTQWKRATLEVVKRSAVFILIATERSKNSSACLDEISAFLEATQSDTTAYHQKRLFIVQKFVSRHADYRLDDWALPGHLREVFSSVVYKKFFGTDPTDRNNFFYNYNPRLEGYSRDMFIKGLHDLAGEVAEVIFELNQTTVPTDPDPPLKAEEGAAESEDRASRIIYLSDTPEELKPLRENLMRDLKSQGHLVVASLLDFEHFRSQPGGLIEPDLALFLVGGEGKSQDAFRHLLPQMLLLKEAEKGRGHAIKKILWAPRQQGPEGDSPGANLALVPPRDMSPLAPGDILRLPQARLSDVLDLIKEKLNQEQTRLSVQDRSLQLHEGLRYEGNPFPGLRPFEAEDARLFFGRDSQIAAVKSIAVENGILFVLGVSGSGKSSLVKCGLANHLLKEAQDEKWLVASFTPGNDPIGNLARALCKQPLLGPRLIGAYLSDQDPGSGERAVKNALGLTSLALADLLGRPGRMQAGERLLLVVDQFEEVFRYARAEPDADSPLPRLSEAEAQSTQLVRLLLAAAEQNAPHLRIVVTMRSDYLGECSRFRGLPEAVNRAHYLIPRMTRHELEQAICKPVELAQGRISHGIVSDLIDKISTEQDQLPLFQHTLFRMWHLAAQRATAGEFPLLSDEVYEEIGSPQSALDRHMEEVFQTLSLPQREIAGWVFRLICREGLGNRPERHPRRVSELLLLLNGCMGQDLKEEEMLAAIRPFQEEKNCFISPLGSGDEMREAMVDLIHESVARCWHRLDGWIKEEAELSSFFDHLIEDARTWQLNQRPVSFLLGNERYRYFENLFLQLGKQSIWHIRFHVSTEECATALEFWRESRHENQRRVNKRIRNRIRRRVVVLIVGLLSVGVLTGGSLYLSEKNKQLKLQMLKIRSEEGQNEEMKAKLNHQKHTNDSLLKEYINSYELLTQRKDSINKMHFHLETEKRLVTEYRSKSERELADKQKAVREADSLLEKSYRDSMQYVRQQRNLLENERKRLQRENALILANGSMKEKETDLKTRQALTAWAMFLESGHSRENSLVYNALIEAMGGKELEGIPNERKFKQEIEALTTSPDGNRLAIALNLVEILIWNRNSERPVSVPTDGELVKALTFSADGSQLAWGSKGKIYVSEKGQKKGPLETGMNEVNCLAFSENAT